MRYISSKEIEELNISPETCVEWVKEAFLIKNQTQLPPKISLHPRGTDFINTMPCLLPEEYGLFGCKVVSRIAGQHPALSSELMVVDTLTGKMKALMNADWITATRTGAVAALAINTLKSTEAKIYSFIGLGTIGQSTLRCFLSTHLNEPMTIRLMNYKDHAEKTILEFSEFENVRWEISHSIEELVDNADVIVSCITDAKGLLVEDTTLFKEGVLVVPVHTRGFQNCDLVFDKVFADDEGHVSGFKYFDRFKKFGELGEVLNGNIQGRENNQERILSYNIGLGLHDIYFAYKLLEISN